MCRPFLGNPITHDVCSLSLLPLTQMIIKTQKPYTVAATAIEVRSVAGAPCFIETYFSGSGNVRQRFLFRSVVWCDVKQNNVCASLHFDNEQPLFSPLGAMHSAEKRISVSIP